MTNLIEALHEQLEECPCSEDNICNRCLEILDDIERIMNG